MLEYIMKRVDYMKDKISVLKYSGVYLLVLMCTMLIFTSTLYLFNISITKLHFFISIILSIGIVLLINKKKFIDKKVLISSLVLSFIVLVVSITSMSFIYDRSSDGNTYHKDAVGNLYLGWNPVYESSTDFVNDNLDIKNYDMHNYDIWKDHYAKANWILEANFYKLTDNIESGKALNIIFMYILFVLSVGYLYEKLNKKSFILASIITFNPICCNQLFTFYNDQLGTSLLFILVVALLSIVDKKDKSPTILKFLILSSVFILITNIKFNIMGYGLIFTFVFMLRYLYIKYKEKELGNSLKRLIPLYVILFVISFGLVGYSTYIKNFVDHGNPFFPVYGDKAEDIITAQQPKDFVDKNNVEKFFIGTFSKVNNLQSNKEYEFKIPFTFNTTEIKDSMAVDTRLSGFGIWSSGLFILSIIALIIYFIKNDNKEEKLNIILLLSITLLLILVISESWWARYNPENYLFIIILSYLILKYLNNKYLKYGVIGLVVINSLIILLGNTYYSGKESLKINSDLNSISNKDVNISFNLGDMTGIIYNLNDKDVNYTFVKKDKLSNLSYYKYLNYEEVDNER